jgi:hypothetical protein
MKKILLPFLILQFYNFANAQDFTSLQVSSGFNADVIANGVNPSAISTNIAVDNANFAFLSADFLATESSTPSPFGLPESGYIENVTTTGLYYQLADYSQNNSLRIQDENEYGTLTFSNQVAATNLYIIATSGSGQSTLSGTIYFSDNTTQDLNANVIPDWFFSSVQPVVLSGFGRVNLLNDVVENPSGNPRLYQIEIQILSENQSKSIANIEFYKSSAAEGIINILGVSAKLLGSCPSPDGLEVTTTDNSATVNWSPAALVPAGGYDYYFATTSDVPSTSQTPTGNVASNLNTLTLSNLVIGQEYFFWIRSNCSTSDFGVWHLIRFTTGQISFTNNDGDITTEYVLNTDLTVDSTNSCPGYLSVNVPPGFKIASTSTAYSMQTAGNGWKSEQRSLLVCNTTGLFETEISSGVGNASGTYAYSRDNIDVANEAIGTVEFELRAWRTYGSSACNTDFNKVVNGTWRLTITYEPISLEIANDVATNFSVYPNPTKNVLNIVGKENIDGVRIFNILGQEVIVKNEIAKEKVQLNISDLSNGSYILQINTATGVYSLKILKY